MSEARENTFRYIFLLNREKKDEGTITMSSTDYAKFLSSDRTRKYNTIWELIYGNIISKDESFLELLNKENTTLKRGKPLIVDTIEKNLKDFGDLNNSTIYFNYDTTPLIAPTLQHHFNCPHCNNKVYVSTRSTAMSGGKRRTSKKSSKKTSKSQTGSKKRVSKKTSKRRVSKK
jgi:hypothetical protein